jgi:hypothetical protein
MNRRTAIAVFTVSLGLAVWATAGAGPALGGLSSPSVSAIGCPSGPSLTGTSQGSPSRPFFSILGVVRRPATAADALPAWVTHALGRHEQIFVRYVRRAETAFGRTYYVVLEISRRLPLCKVQEGIGLIGADATDASGGGRATLADIEAGGPFGTRGTSLRALISGVVPDGVATVTFCYPAGPASGFSPKVILPAVCIKGQAVNNVVVSVPRGAANAIGPKMIWRNAAGQVIKTIPAQSS